MRGSAAGPVACLSLCALLAACAPVLRPAGYDADIAAGRYAAALARLGPIGAEGQPHEIHAEAALLRVLLGEPRVSDAYCRDLRGAYPRAVAYSTLLCDIVLSMVGGGAPDEAAVGRLVAHVAERPPHRYVVVEALRRHASASR